MPQNPDFSRKMMGFDGGVRVCASATLRCTSKTHGDNAVGFCFFGAPWVRTPIYLGFQVTLTAHSKSPRRVAVGFAGAP